MAIIDARDEQSPFEIHTDVCVVGAGAAGLTVAAQLLARSREVCLLEAGGFVPEAQTQELHEFESVGYSLRKNRMSRARYFGGTCNLWAGRAMRLTHFDIADRPWLGLEGWPLPYSDLEAYYVRSAPLLRLPRWGAFESTSAIPGASADEVNVLGSADLLPNIALWAKKPLRFGDAHRKLLQRDARCKAVLHANAKEIVLDASGRRVESVVAVTLEGKAVIVRPKRVVLAAGGLENARLLLVSDGVQPHGIGNDHDAVGRCYMDHPRAVFGRVQLARPARLPLLLGTPLADGKVQMGIGLSMETQKREGLVNSYVSFEPLMSAATQRGYEASISVAQVLLRKGYAGKRWDASAMRAGGVKDMIYLLTLKELLPYPLYRAYVAAKRRLRGGFTRGKLTIVNYCEQLPNRESRVALGRNRDRLDMAKLVVDWRIGDEERMSLVRLHELLGKRLAESGIGTLETRPEDVAGVTFMDASHHTGTTRMSENPRLGVVDRDCRVHGVANLYVAGSSVFPTSGNANPTWTIVALAQRLADHLCTAATEAT